MLPFQLQRGWPLTWRTLWKRNSQTSSSSIGNGFIQTSLGKCHSSNANGSQLWMVPLRFFGTMVLWKQSAFSRSHPGNFSFGSSPKLVTCGMTLSQGRPEKWILVPWIIHNDLIIAMDLASRHQRIWKILPRKTTQGWKMEVLTNAVFFFFYICIDFKCSEKHSQNIVYIPHLHNHLIFSPVDEIC